MAVTSIWRVNGWLGKVVVYVENPDKTTNPEFYENEDMMERDCQGLDDVIFYAVNSRKTELHKEDSDVLERFVSGVNCHPATARAEMLSVKKRFGKEDGTIAYHGYQSFAPGEATPEIAHQIGVELAQRLWGDRYQVVVATHLDKANHLHNHFVLNTVSFVDGIKYHRTAKDYHDLQQQRRETKEYMTDLTSRDQRMMLSVLTIVHLADTKAELDADTDALLKVAADHMCQMAVPRYQQLDGLNTALPIGTRKIDTFRTLTTESLAVFMPFKVQEIQEPGGIYFGENAISHNLILCNMNNLLNQSMMLLGIPGSGKSFFAKLLIIAIALSTDDDIIILDPEGEYTPLVKALGGSVIRYAVGGSDWVNAMDMENGYGEGSPVAFKSQFIMSLLKQVDPDGIGAHQKSIIDRCVAQVFREQKQTGGVPTLCTVREKLLEQPEPEARGLALTMELYTSGSLDIFAHETNVDTQNSITSHDIHALSEDLKQPGFVTITDAMLNRVNRNWAQGRKTHVFIDEFHIAYENEYSGNFFTSAWRQFRKRNAAPCAITQNVEYLLDSIQASTMLSNSEFIVMLNQAESDQERLSRLLNISPEQMSYVNGAEAGCGLMRYGNALVPFVNRFPADTELYKLITTKPGEGLFAKGQVDFHA